MTPRSLGYTQSGPLFHAKTRALEKALLKAFPSSTLHYPTAPLALRPADIPGYTPSGLDEDPDKVEAFGWWQRREGAAVYSGIDRGLGRVAETIHSEGPFDGVIGFSQGGAVAAMVASLLEPGRHQIFETNYAKNHQKYPYPSSFLDRNREPIQRPLKFAIVYSGFAAPFELYSSFYEPEIKTPVLHVLGSLDTVVEEKRSRFLQDSCERSEERTAVHPGGHFVPNQKIWVDIVIGFIRSCLGESKSMDEETDESVEGMDVPF